MGKESEMNQDLKSFNQSQGNSKVEKRVELEGFRSSNE
jgi:hypothetical protein